MFHKCIFFVVPISLSYICTVVYANKVDLSNSFCNILYWQHVPEKEEFVTTFKFGKKHFLVKVIINLTLYTLGHLKSYFFINKPIITCTNSFTSDKDNPIHSLFNNYTIISKCW